VGASGLGSCYVRPIAYYGNGEMGHTRTPAPSTGIAAAVGAYSADDGVTKGERMKVTRGPPRPQQHAARLQDTGNYVNSSLAKVER